MTKISKLSLATQPTVARNTSEEYSRSVPPKRATDALKKVEKRVGKHSAMLIKVAIGKSYADVIGKLRKKVDPEASQNRVLVKKEELLIRTGGSCNRNFEEKLTREVGDMGKV